MTIDRNSGHRERLRARLLENPASLAPYEVLELVLMIAVPRRDVKPLAKGMIAKFGDFSGVVRADPAALIGTVGVGETVAAAIKSIEAACILMLRTDACKKSVISDWSSLLNYCRISIGGKTTEEFHVLYLNTKCMLIKDEVHSTGTINSSSVYPREILKSVLELGAASVILVHNHPTGDVSPSKADVDITRRVAGTLAAVDVPVHDHLIIGDSDVASFNALGLL